MRNYGVRDPPTEEIEMDAQGSNDFLYSISRRFIQSPEQIRRFFFLIGVFLVVILLVFGGRSQP